MNDQPGGDSLQYRVDWDAGEMTLLQSSGVLADRFGPETLSITPLFRALRLKYPADLAGTDPRRFLIDVQCQGETITLSLHRTSDFSSVVNVSRALVEDLLIPPLTPREAEVAVELFEGRTIRYIASELHIAEGTVKRNIHNIYQKMKVSSQVELIREIYIRLAEHAGQQRIP